MCLHCSLQRAGTQFVTRSHDYRSPRFQQPWPFHPNPGAPSRDRTSTSARRSPDSGNPPRPIRLPDRAGHNDLALEASEGRTEQPRDDRRRRSQQREAGRWFGTKAMDRLHCILPVHGGCTDAAVGHQAFSLVSSGRRDREASSPSGLVCRSIILIPWPGRTQSGCPGKPVQPPVDSPPAGPPGACDDAKERHG